MGIPLMHLNLDAPLQSWGIRSKWWYHRDTSHEPTKSGVVGILSSGLGLERNDPKIEKLHRELKMGVRCERAFTLMGDYQTITGGYYSADRKFIYDGIILNKDYLQHAFYLVVLSGTQELLNKLKKALKSPKYDLFLGRKSCIPASPIFSKISRSYLSIKDALEKIPWSLEWRLEFPQYFVINEIPEKLRCIIDDSEGNILKNDIRLINEAKIRTFSSRKVSEFFVKTPLKNEKNVEAFNVSF